MPKWKIVDKTAFVNGTVTVNIDLSSYPKRFEKAQRELGNMVLNSSKKYMPLLTGSLQQRSYVSNGGKKVVFPGPYARYLYGGRVMVDSVTGKGPAMIPGIAGKGPAKIYDKNGVEVGLRFRKGATLKPTQRRLTYSQEGARAEWFQAAKDDFLQEWIEICEKIIKEGT